MGPKREIVIVGKFSDGRSVGRKNFGRPARRKIFGRPARKIFGRTDGWNISGRTDGRTDAQTAMTVFFYRPARPKIPSRLMFSSRQKYRHARMTIFWKYRHSGVAWQYFLHDCNLNIWKKYRHVGKIPSRPLCPRWLRTSQKYRQRHLKIPSPRTKIPSSAAAFMFEPKK